MILIRAAWRVMAVTGVAEHEKRVSSRMGQQIMA